MTNLTSAKESIQAELTHAKEGLGYYTSRVATLEKALAQLAAIGAEAVDPTVTANVKRGPKALAAKPVKPAKATKIAFGAKATEKPAKPAKKAKVAKDGAKELPFTGKDYWPNLVTDQPKSATEILEAAIAGLGFTPTKAQIQKLAGRQTFALNTLVKVKTIQDSGKGRERRFFKAS